MKISPIFSPLASHEYAQNVLTMPELMEKIAEIKRYNRKMKIRNFLEVM